MKIKKFILARLEEKQYLALTAQSVASKWTTRSAPNGEGYPFDVIAEFYSVDADRFITVNSDPDSPSVDEYAAPHIAFNDPDHVLREVAAQRALVASQPSYRLSRGMPKIQFLDDGTMQIFRSKRWQPFTKSEFRAKYTVPLAPSLTLRLLAAPYSEHPDFDPSWGIEARLAPPVKDLKTLLGHNAVEALVKGTPKMSPEQKAFFAAEASRSFPTSPKSVQS